MNKFDSLVHKAIIKTVCYSDVFDYPLKKNELIKYLIWEADKNHPSVSEIEHVLSQNIFPVIKKNNYYLLTGREVIVKKRMRKYELNNRKYVIANKVVNYLKNLPTIKLIAITGGLAMHNANKNDDIDFMIIVSKRRLWITRLMVTVLVSLIFKRRKPQMLRGSKCELKNTICLNLYLEEDYLAVPNEKRNLYSAHEVVQVKPLFEKDSIMRRFLSNNKWVSTYIPHAMKLNKFYNNTQKVKEENIMQTQLTDLFLLTVEKLAYALQLMYMKSKISREYITPTAAYFHPKNTSEIVLHKYRKLLKIYLNSRYWLNN